MEDNLRSESDAYREIERLKSELDGLLDREKLGYTELMRIDEINERLQELDPLPREFSIRDEWGRFEKEFLSGGRAADETKRTESTGSTESTECKPVKRLKLSRFGLLGLAAVMVAVISVFSTMLVGVDLFSGFRILTDDTIEIRYNEEEPSETETEGFESYGSVEELEEFLDIKLMVPKWLPEGYEPGYVIYSAESNSVVIRCYKEDSEDEIVQIIRKLTDGKRAFVPKDDTPPYTVVHNNIEFNVYGNNGESFIEWTYNGYSYYLSGVLDEDEISKIIAHTE